MNRVAQHLVAISTNFRVRYALAHGLAHLLPLFAAGPIRARLYRRAGFSIGEGTSLLGPLRILSGTNFYDNLTIGPNAIIANDVTINVDGEVRIGDSASIGPLVRIYTGTHAIGPGSRRMLPIPIGKPVTIGRGAWIGLGTIVLPGVTIGDGCVIGAGSVVGSDIDAHTYAEGNPAKVMRSLPWRDR
jgi:maltose O-acetyltransferase